jgi:hypothetical protein
MTNVSTERKSVIHYGAPCWVLRRPDGGDLTDGGDGIPHYDTSALAAEVIQPEWGPDAATPAQLASGCWVVTCAGCSADLDSDMFAREHFADEKIARWQAEQYDWVEGPDGELYCGTDCLPDGANDD